MAGARGGAAGLEGFARGEVGWHITPTASAFAFGDASISKAGPEWQAGVGLRATW